MTQQYKAVGDTRDKGEVPGNQTKSQTKQAPLQKVIVQ